MGFPSDLSGVWFLKFPLRLIILLEDWWFVGLMDLYVNYIVLVVFSYGKVIFQIMIYYTIFFALKKCFIFGKLANFWFHHMLIFIFVVCFTGL